jgi:hypothetical protein
MFGLGFQGGGYDTHHVYGFAVTQKGAVLAFSDGFATQFGIGFSYRNQEIAAASPCRTLAQGSRRATRYVKATKNRT